MANSIEVVVSKQAISGLEDLYKNLDKSHKKIIEISKTQIDFAGGSSVKGLSDFNAKMKEAVSLNAKLAKENEKLANALAKLKAKQSEVTITSRNLERQSLRESQSRNALNAQRERELALIAREQARLAISEQLYNRVQSRMTKYQNEYRNLAVQKELFNNLTDKEKKRMEALERAIQKYDKTLKGVDASMGNYRRNVGNYAGAFDPLSNSINQLSREMPAFANSVQTGFMAISNNLPVFFDAVQGIIDQNRELQAQGQPTRSVLSQIGSSLLSVQTLLSVGVTLLTVYGKDIVNYFTSGSESVEEFEKNIKEVNSTVTDQAVKLGVVKKVLNDTNSTQKQYAEALRISKENGISLNAVEQARRGNLELINSELDKNIKMSIAKAQVDRLISLAAEEEIKRGNLKQEGIAGMTKWYRKLLDVQISGVNINNLILDQQVKEIKASQIVSVQYQDRIKQLLEFIDVDEKTTSGSVKNLKALEIANQNYFASDFELKKRILELNIEANDKILQNDKLAFDERFNAEKSFYFFKNELVELEYNEEKRAQEQFRKDELKKINEDFSNQLAEIKEGVSNAKQARIQAINERNKAIINLEKDNKNKVELIEVNHNEKILQLVNSQVDSIVEAKERLTSRTSEENLISSQSLDSLKQLLEIRKKLNSKSSVKDFQDLEEQKTIIEARESLKRLELDKNETEEKLANFDLYKKGSAEREEIEKEYLSIKRKIFDETSKLDEEAIKKQEELAKLLQETYSSFQSDFANNSGFSKLLDIIGGGLDKFKGDAVATALVVSEAFQEAFNTIAQASQGNFDAEYQRLEMQKENSLKFAGDSATAREEIERQAEEKRKEIARREAQAQKRLAIFNIVTNTAQAIIATLAKTPAPVGIPLAVATGILGAAQLAVVASQQIPQFWMGGEHDGGLMMVNDGKGSNFRETIVTPDGKIEKPTGRNVIMNRPKGTQIFTHDQWNEVINKQLSSAGIQPMRGMVETISQQNSLTTEDFNAGISKLAKSLQSNKGGNTQVYLNNKPINTDYFKGKNV